jgi:hypothetical protein
MYVSSDEMTVVTDVRISFFFSFFQALLTAGIV